MKRFTEEQLAERRQGIGSSDIAAVAGISPWRTPVDVYLDKIGEGPPDEESEAMSIGSELEEMILRRGVARAEADGLVSPPIILFYNRATIFHPTIPWVYCTTDGTVGWGGGGGGIAEAKNVGYRAVSFWDDGPPSYVLAQVQWQMLVHDVAHALVPALIGGHEMRTHLVEADAQVQGDLLAIGEAFMRRVTERRPPEEGKGSESFARHLERRRGQYKGQVVEADEEMRRVLDDIFQAREAAASAEAKREVATSRLREAMIAREASVVVFDHDGASRRVSWSECRGRVDWEAVARELGATPEQAEKHRGSATTRLTFPRGW